jgi:hypothetical protein
MSYLDTTAEYFAPSYDWEERLTNSDPLNRVEPATRQHKLEHAPRAQPLFLFPGGKSNIPWYEVRQAHSRRIHVRYRRQR